jgi:glycosidase
MQSKTSRTFRETSLVLGASVALLLGIACAESSSEPPVTNPGTSGQGGQGTAGMAGFGFAGTTSNNGQAGSAGSTAGSSSGSAGLGGSSGTAGASGTAGDAGSAGQSGIGGGAGSSGTAGTGGSPLVSPDRVRIYQVFTRHWGNSKTANQPSATIDINGSGKFSVWDQTSLNYVKQLGFSHVWLTGVIRHASLTSYPNLAADDPDIVKGRAGSPFAIKDYYDVDPDLADNPAQRMMEFEALVARVHQAGLKLLLDFVPNHVSRAYNSSVKPESSFGINDDQTQFFSPTNDFYYLAQPAGQSLSVTGPVGWDPGGLDGAFPPEDGMLGHVPKATGNNQTSVTLGPNDWYETIKLNYGFQFAGGTTAYQPQPGVWAKMDAILGYWQSKGVDGFRCDFAHYVPVEFWNYAITQAHSRQPDVFFLAEAYDDSPGVPQAGSAPGTHPQSLISQGGFDAVYDHWTFNASRQLAAGVKWANDFDDVRQGDTYVKQYTRYVENHDERRGASPLVANAGPGDTGYGSPESTFAHAAATYLSSGAPIVLYAGQELGEKGAGAEGFGGEDGRSTIFDYWNPPALASLHAAGYNSAQLPSAQQTLAARYQALMALSNEPAMRVNAPYYGLNFANKDHPTTGSAFGENGHWMYAFLRYVPGEQVLLVVVNLNSNKSFQPTIYLPESALTLAGLSQQAMVNAQAKIGTFTGIDKTPQALGTEGLSLSIPANDYIVLTLQ